MTVTAILWTTIIMDLVPDTLLPQRLLRVATSPPLFSSLSSYRHSINLFLVFACPTSTSFTPDDMQFVPLSIKPIRSSSPSIHGSASAPVHWTRVWTQTHQYEASAPSPATLIAPATPAAKPQGRASMDTTSFPSPKAARGPYSPGRSRPMHT